MTEAEERAAAEKRVKSRTLGTVRLIAELFRKEVVSEAIVLVCVRELLEVRQGFLQGFSAGLGKVVRGCVCERRWSVRPSCWSACASCSR